MIILASQSPRRQALLRYIFEDFVVRPAVCDETLDPGRDIESQTVGLAMRKAMATAAEPDDLVIAADTLVSLHGETLGKPTDAADAFRMLTRLSGGVCTVYTGVAVRWRGQYYGLCEQTDVTFFPLSEDEIRDYIASGEPLDKAGAFGAQGPGALLIRRIDGDFYNVMGLPVAMLARLLSKIGAR
jgi:septum formation protein